MGLILTSFGACVLGEVLFTKLFHSWVWLFHQQPHPAVSSTTTWLLSLLMLLILVVDVVLANRYKLRERKRHINIHAIVKEHY